MHDLNDRGELSTEDLIQTADDEIPWLPTRLASRIAHWRKITSCAFILSILSCGYRLEWNTRDVARDQKKGPAPPCDLRNAASCHATGNAEFLDSAIHTAVSMGAIRRFKGDPSTCCIQPLGVDVRKKNGKRRMIYDARHVNDYTTKQKFKFETLHREGRSIFSGCQS